MPETSPDLRTSLLAAARAELDAGGTSAVSLRAVARRAGVSHAAPAYAFGDRAGLLTAVATQGFEELAAVMDAATTGEPQDALADLGRRYVNFAHATPALYDLMFRPEDLVTDDPDLVAARHASLAALTRLTRTDGAPGPPSEVTLVSWAFAHGVASLVTQGAVSPDTTSALFEDFARRMLA